jgi:outer membrane biosynthesis protein TonB
MRYARVQAILEQEAAFVAKMGSATEVVFRPNGSEHRFAPEVIAVTQAIHSAGKDAHKVHKTEVIKCALKIFRIGQPALPPEATNGAPVAVEAPTPAVPAAPAPKPAKAAPAAASKPAKAAQKPPQKQKLQPAATQAPAPAPEPPKKEEPPKPSVPAENVNKDRDTALKEARETLNPERPGENTAANNAYISMYSMSLTLLQLVELYDNQPGRDRRMKLFDDVAKEFNKFTTIKSAKEAQKAQP